MSPFTIIGDLILRTTQWLWLYTGLITQLICLTALLLIAIRYLTDRFKVNPFGRLPFYLRRPTDHWYHHVRQSPLYYSFKKALQFEPVWLIMVLGLLLIFLLLPGAFALVAGMLQAIGLTLINFGANRFGAGLLALIGTICLAGIYFLILQMTVLVVNFFFGILQHQAQAAGRIIYPLINPLVLRFDRTGQLFPLFFLLLSFLLQFVASLIRRIFF